MKRRDARMSKPYEMLGRKCTASLNTTRFAIRFDRINKEIMRQKLVKASFVPAARLVANGETIKVVKVA